MAPPRRWIRVDVGWSRSDWVAALEPPARLAWIELLTYVKTDGTAGTVRSLSPAIFGRMCGIDPGDVEAMLEAAETDGALIIAEKEWTVVKWPEYQETDPTAAERQRRYRAEKSRLSPLRKEPVTTRNAPVTNGVTRHATVTETVTETEQKHLLAQPDVEPGADPFEKFWQARPRRHGSDSKKRAHNAWRARRKERIPAAAMIEAVERYRKFCEADGKIGTQYVMQAATFLGDPENFSKPWTPGTRQPNGRPPDPADGPRNGSDRRIEPNREPPKPAGPEARAAIAELRKKLGNG